MPVKKEPRKGGFKIVGSGGGGKSGGSARTPVESPDSLHNTSYAAILDVISNGEVFGPAHPEAPLKDIYLDGTPIQNDDDSLNFQRVETDYRVGTIDQDHIAGFPASASVTSVGTEITTSTPWVQQITGTELSAVRVSINVPTLLRTYDSGDNAGDRVGYKVDYAIDIATGGGSFVEYLTASFDGKTTNGYTRTHRVELPSGASTWAIRVRRTSPEASSTTIQDAIFLDSYAEVIDGKFRHPMTALVGLKIDAEQFQSIPTRAYHWKGRIIRVPSNYDPEARTYSGVWDGTFKSAYSNNPAWVFFDMLTNNLYGLGEYIATTVPDRYALYQIGAYCDQLVSDGNGGTEPRFTCNCYIQSAQDALRVLNDLASIFRGMSYWADAQVVPVADMPSDPVYNYTNANVIDGRFEYSGSDIKTRKTVALVSYNDPTDFYRSKTEVVEDEDGIARYGIRKTEVVAFGCTSRGQAQRVGLYLLYTSRMETGGVSFSVGLDGVIPQPGSIVKIADRNRAGRHIGGRISSAGDDFIVTDRDHPAKIGDTINVNLPSGSSESRTVTAIDERKITVSPDFSELPESQSVWSIDADDLVTQQVRIVSIAETDGIQYDISAVNHHPDKFAAIDSGVRLDPLPISVVPPRTQNAPTNIQITQFNTFKQGITRQNAEITWDAPENAVQYDIQWKRDNGDWVVVPRTGSRTVQISDVFSGEYLVRVRAINSLDVPSLWAYSDATQLDGIVAEPPALTTLTATGQVMAIQLDWSYPVTPNIISQVEIRASLTNDFASSYPLTFVSYPSTTFTVNGLGYGTEMWFWARLLDKNGLAGDWFPLETGAGTFGQSSQSATEILDYLQGQISESELAQSLTDTIDGIEIDISDLFNSVDDVNTLIQTETTERTSADSALSQQITTLGSTVDGNTSAIQAEITARADGDSALSQQITTLQSVVDDNEALIQQTSQALTDLDGALNATWQVKTEVRSDGRVVQAGVALGASIGEDGTSRSEFLVLADTVGFLTTIDGQIHAPFVFDTVNDTAILNSAIIGNATIDFAKITDTLQSTNYSAGSAGWNIRKNGFAEFSNIVARGAIYADVGELNNVIINEDCTILGTLEANRIVGDIVSAAERGFFNRSTTANVAQNAWVDILRIGITNQRNYPRTLYLVGRNGFLTAAFGFNSSGTKNFEFRLVSKSLGVTIYSESFSVDSSTVGYDPRVNHIIGQIPAFTAATDFYLQVRCTSNEATYVFVNYNNALEYQGYRYTAFLYKESGELS